MIYKFIDNNGSEITVNSLSSLQGLVDSETINENTIVIFEKLDKFTLGNNENLNWLKSHPSSSERIQEIKT